MLRLFVRNYSTLTNLSVCLLYFVLYSICHMSFIFTVPRTMFWHSRDSNMWFTIYKHHLMFRANGESSKVSIGWKVIGIEKRQSDSQEKKYWKREPRCCWQHCLDLLHDITISCYSWILHHHGQEPLEIERLFPVGNQEGPESKDFTCLPGCNREEICVKMHHSKHNFKVSRDLWRLVITEANTQRGSVLWGS